MKSFINSSSDSDSDSKNSSRKSNQLLFDGQNDILKDGNRSIEEKRTPLKQSVFEYMAQAKVVIRGTADLEDHIQSTSINPSGLQLIHRPKKKKRKTFYDSSDDDEEEETNMQRRRYDSPNNSPQSQNLVIGDLVTQISPPKLSNSADNTPTHSINETDIWMEDDVRENQNETITRHRKRKNARESDLFSSDEDLFEEVRPQLKTAVPVREMTPITLKGIEEKKPSLKRHLQPSEATPEPCASTVLEACINKYAAQYLKDYQIQGVQWLFEKFSSKAGCILGDDMGLGKTIQVIALLLALFEKTGKKSDDHQTNRMRRRRSTEEKSLMASLTAEPKKWTLPCLIVCPASVIDNWRDELLRWGYFLVRHLGTNQDGGCDMTIEDAKNGRVEVLICSYSKMQAYSSDLADVSWSLIIWDEGHNLKTSTTKTYKAAFSLSKAQCRIILTGTPIQNKLEELWCLLNLVTHGRFNDKTSFKTHFVTPIKRAQQRSASLEIQRLGLKRQNELKKLVSRYLLQRLKSEVLAEYLQGKDDIVVFCELSPLQNSLYKHILELPDVDNARWSMNPCPCGSKRARKLCCEEYQIPLCRNGHSEIDIRAAIWRQNHPDFSPCQHCPSCVLLPAISKLLKVASHPYLLKEYRHNIDNGVQSKTYEFACTALTDEHLIELGGPLFSSNILSGSRIEMSGKMKALDRLLSHFMSNFEKVRLSSWISLTGHRLFSSQIEKAGDIGLYRYLCLLINNSRLDGSTSTTSRQSLVDKFNSDHSLLLFLMSTKAGGLGLNLTSASKVIVFDCNWNPALDMQAQDRAYRFGQTRHVSVYRLVAQGTVEELIYMRQLYKQSLQKTAVKVSEAITSVSRRFEDTTARFEGIQGEVSGELFGIENMLQFEEGSILMKLRERYRTVINSDDEEELTEGEEANEIQSPDRKDLLQPSTPTGSRPSLISITEDHAVNILSQLTKSTPTKIHANSAAH